MQDPTVWQIIQSVATGATLIFVLARTMVGARRKDIDELTIHIDAISDRLLRLEEWRTASAQPTLELLGQKHSQILDAVTTIRVEQARVESARLTRTRTSKERLDLE